MARLDHIFGGFALSSAAAGRQRSQSVPQRSIWLREATALLIACWGLAQASEPTPPGQAAISPGPILTTGQDGYVGSIACKECHPSEYTSWARSPHGQAERQVHRDLDRPSFEPETTFKSGSQTIRVRLLAGESQIVCLGFHTNAQPYRVERVIGFEPLRQFLTPAPGGRWQAQEAAYDPRSNQWFNIYGQEDRQPGEWGHWTGRGMNWNSRCADCHNTRVKKNFNESTDTYGTTMAEMGVGCEACHGPLREHLNWRRQNPKAAGHESAPPVVKRPQSLDACGACHSRRDVLTGEFTPGDLFFDHFSLEIPGANDHWYADGQVKEEDYEFASFLGSRMFQSGVHCRDCHRSDSGRGNDLCMRCHQGNRAGFRNAPAINPAQHSHHKLGGTGGECLACHMPVTVYMQRHARHDHGFTIPDPLLTKELGIPNACNRCHADQTVDWMLEYTGKWYASEMQRHTRERTRSIAAGQRGEECAQASLAAMLSGETEPPYWRAVAANLLWRWANEPAPQGVLLLALKDSHPLVREKAVRALEAASESAPVASALRSALDDPVRCVRVAAAWALRATIDSGSPASRDLDRALSLDADQPDGQFRRAMLLLARRQPAEALPHMEKAVAWDPFSPPLRYEEAMLLSMLGKDSQALDELGRAEKLAPQDPLILVGYANLLARNGRFEEAEAAANRALSVDPDFRSAKVLLQELHAHPRPQAPVEGSVR